MMFTKEMKRALGFQRPQEAQKAKALCKMLAAKDAGDEYKDPTREDNILERSKTRLALWKEHFEDPIVALDKALKCVWTVRTRRFRPECLVEEAFSKGRCWLPSKFVGKTIWDGVWLHLHPIEKRVFTHSIHGMECARKLRAA